MYARCLNYTFILDIPEILINIYIWVFSVNSDSVYPTFTFYLICVVAIVLKIVFVCKFWRLKTLVLWWKIVQNLLIFMYLFCSKCSTIDSRKTLLTLEWLVVESCPSPRRIAFLVLNRLVYIKTINSMN